MMMKNLGKLAVILLLTSFNSLALAEVSAYLNQNTFYEGDAITLNIESSMETDARPDLSVLAGNFTVLGPIGTNSQINIFNGQRSVKRIWTVELKSKKRGFVEIPAISIGSEKTLPMSIKVSALPPEVKAETEKHIFIETSIGVSGNETYVQQQIPYTVKLYFDSAMQSGEITQPDVENAVVEELTRDKRYTVARDGRKFNVIEKHFAISPEKSGTLLIPSTSVDGRIALSGGDSPKLRRRMNETEMLNKFFNNFNNDPFFKGSFGDDFFGRRRSAGPSQPFSVKSKAIEVNVLPVPKEFLGKAWLPAEELNIIDSWTRSPPILKVGEPVTRTLILRAKGLGGSQIPTIDVSKPDGIKIYPEQPTSKTHTDGVTLIGRQNFDITYIPQKKGKVIIPEIKVDWWNIKTKKQETYTLSAWQLNVAPGVLNSKSDAQEESAIDTKKEALAINKVPEAVSSQASAETSSDLWSGKTLSLLLGLGIFLAALLFLINMARKKLNLENGKANKIKLKKLRVLALQACQKNDKKVAAKTVLKLAQVQWNDDSIQSLGSLALQLKEGSMVIKELEASLYSPSFQSWNGRKLQAIIEKGMLQQGFTVDKSEILRPLYPI